MRAGPPGRIQMPGSHAAQGKYRERVIPYEIGKVPPPDARVLRMAGCTQDRPEDDKIRTEPHGALQFGGIVAGRTDQRHLRAP